MKKKGNPSAKTDFRPKVLRNKLTDWLSVAGIMLIGALIGLIFGFFFPPKYEATAKLTTNLEVVTSTNVTEIMVDSQVDLIGTLVFHPDVVERVRLSLADQGRTYTSTELKSKTKIERQLMTTLIKVRDTDPEVAALIASTWAEEAYGRLSEAFQHALALSEAKATQAMVVSCFNDTQQQKLPLCQSLTTEKAAQLLGELKGVILDESPLSLGLTGELNISQYQPAPIPNRPVAQQRSTMILAGAIAGLMCALLLGELLVKEHNRE